MRVWWSRARSVYAASHRFIRKVCKCRNEDKKWKEMNWPTGKRRREKRERDANEIRTGKKKLNFTFRGFRGRKGNSPAVLDRIWKKGKHKTNVAECPQNVWKRAKLAVRSYIGQRWYSWHITVVDKTSTQQITLQFGTWRAGHHL